MNAATGVVVLAQETRFRLVDETGRAQMFLLSRDAPIEPEDLQDLQRRQARVTVRFNEPEDLIARVAHDLFLDEPIERRTGDPR